MRTIHTLLALLLCSSCATGIDAELSERSEALGTAPASTPPPVERAATPGASAGPAPAGLEMYGERERGAPRTDPESPRFTLAVLPDTQYLLDQDSDLRASPEPVAATLRYLLASDAVGREERNFRFLAQLGDVTEHGTAAEMALADTVFRALDGRFPYSVLAGNHDVSSRTDDQRGATPFLNTFGPVRFRGDRTFAGASPDGYNRFHVFVAGGRRWLVLALDWRLSDAGFAWAQRVIDTNPTLPVIVTTHELAASGDDGVAQLSAYGKRLWDRLIRKNDQIFLTLNGHFWPPGRTVLKNDAGHDVHVHITNYQDRYFGGSGMLRLYGFDLARNRIDVETFSPWILAKAARERTPLEHQEVTLSDEANRFSIALDFAQRFAGFDPTPARAARPAGELLVPGTVAYWRFDEGAADGALVPAGTVFRDLSARGNDLTVSYLDGAEPKPLVYSADHHPDQPAHTSLFIEGGQSPARGAILRTAEGAPLNSLAFPRGYTLEAFVKLPPAYDDGTHNWMGILSWFGRSADAGKMAGDPDEPVASLNVSPERFLQWISYPPASNGSVTSWSHAIPTSTWAHVAVVNDGRRTRVYVNGSPIARNPKASANAIATTGSPFAIGGTQYANVFDQSFYGAIGDVRIVDRALPVQSFMIARRRAR